MFKYLRLRANSNKEEATTGEVERWNNNILDWCFECERSWFQWETSQISVFVQEIIRNPMNREKENEWGWQHDEIVEVYPIKSALQKTAHN